MNNATTVTVFGLFDGGCFTGDWFFSPSAASRLAADRNEEFFEVCQDGKPAPFTVRPMPKPATKL